MEKIFFVISGWLIIWKLAAEQKHIQQNSKILPASESIGGKITTLRNKRKIKEIKGNFNEIVKQTSNYAQFQNLDLSMSTKFTCSSIFYPKKLIMLGTADGRLITTGFS